MRNKSSSSRTLAGFTLIEIIISLFIFVIIMSALSHTFVRMFSSYKNARTIQEDIESTQFVMNRIAKELRTSTIVNPTGTLQTSQRVRFFDHSQTPNEPCIEYRISGTQLERAAADADEPSDCSGMSFNGGDFTVVSKGIRGGQFVITSSQEDPKRVGKMTLSLTIGEGEIHRARIQTTVSLRDYGEIGLY